MNITVTITDDFGNKETETFEIKGDVLETLRYLEKHQKRVEKEKEDQHAILVIHTWKKSD